MLITESGRNWDLVVELEGSVELYQGVIDVQEMPPGERFYGLQVD